MCYGAWGRRLLVATFALGGCVPAVLAPPPATMVRKFSGVEVPGTYVSPAAYQAYLLAQLAADAGRPLDAIEQLRHAIASDGSSAYLRVQLAELYLRSGQLDLAREQCDSALELDPNYAEAMVQKARVAEQLEHTIAAESMLVQAAAIRPPSEAAWTELVAFYSRRHDAKKALDAAAKFVAAMPELYESHAAFGRLLVEAGSAPGAADRALAEYQLIVDRWPDRLEPRVILSDLFAARDRLSESIVQLEEVYRRSPSLPIAALLVRRLVLADLVKEAEARADQGELLVKKVGDWVTVAQMRLDVGQPSEALIALDTTLRAIEKKEIASDEGRLVAAQALVRLGRTTEALQLLAAVRTTAPERSAALVRRVDLLIRLGRCDEARRELGTTELSRHVRLDLDVRARECAGERPSALTLLADELKQRSEPEVELLYAEVLLHDGQAQPALTHVIAARQQLGTSARALLVHAQALGRLGKVDEAIALADLAQAQGPDSPTVAGNLGMVYFEEHRFDTAERLLHRALRLDPDQPRLLGALAEIQLARNDRTAALGLFRQALAAGPDATLRAELEHHLAQLDESRVGHRGTPPTAPRPAGRQ